MAAVMVGNHTHAADDIDWFVSQIDCLCQFVNYCPVILNCLQGVVGCQISHPDEPYLLSSVEILSLTCSVNKDGGKLLYDARSDIEYSGVWLSILQVAVTFSRMKGFLYLIRLLQSVVFHSTFDY